MAGDKKPSRSTFRRAESTHSALERVRSLRTRASSSREITGDVAFVQRAVERTSRRIAEIVDAWESLMPSELVVQSRITSYRAGVIHICVASSAALYELDRLLRGGVEDSLRERVRGTVARVRLVVGPVDDPNLTG